VARPPKPPVPPDVANPYQHVRGLAAAPDGKSFLYVQLDSDRVEILISEIGGDMN